MRQWTDRRDPHPDPILQRPRGRNRRPAIAVARTGPRRRRRQAKLVDHGGAYQPLDVPGCGPLLINPGQTGYFRTLYTPAQAEALRATFPRLNPVDQYGLLSDSLALSATGYQPMARALDLLAAVPPNAHGRLAQKGIASWRTLYDADRRQSARRKMRSASGVQRAYGPRLGTACFTPRDGEPPLDALLRPTLIANLGPFLATRAWSKRAERLFAAWQHDPAPFPASLKESWLAVVARQRHSGDVGRASPASPAKRAEPRALGAVPIARPSAGDEALTRRALDLAP